MKKVGEAGPYKISQPTSGNEVFGPINSYLDSSGAYDYVLPIAGAVIGCFIGAASLIEADWAGMVVGCAVGGVKGFNYRQSAANDLDYYQAGRQDLKLVH